MKKYDYNYSVVGVRSLLPMYITFEAENLTDDQAYDKAIELAQKKWPNKKVTIHVDRQKY